MKNLAAGNKYFSPVEGYLPLEALFDPALELPARFRDENNARWNVRRHREEFKSMGAMLELDRKIYINPERLRAALIAIGSGREPKVVGSATFL